MRRLLILAVVASILAAAGCSSGTVTVPGTTVVVGSGTLAEEDRAIAGFTALAHASLGDVHVTTGAAEALTVRAEDNLLEHVGTVVQSGTLWIETESNVDIQPTLGIDFDLTATSLDTVGLLGVGDIDVDALDANEINLVHVGVGSIAVGSVDASTLVATVGGVGSITLAGQVTRQGIVVSGEGDYQAENLQSTHAEVTISGTGDVTVAASATLDVTISGTGSVYYVGNPVVTSVITGTGDVEPL